MAGTETKATEGETLLHPLHFDDQRSVLPVGSCREGNEPHHGCVCDQETWREEAGLGLLPTPPLG